MTKEQAQQALRDKVAAQSTERLIEMARMLNTRTDTESMLVSVYVESELSTRLSTAEFCKLMNEFEAALDAA